MFSPFHMDSYCGEYPFYLTSGTLNQKRITSQSEKEKRVVCLTKEAYTFVEYLTKYETLSSENKAVKRYVQHF